MGAMTTDDGHENALRATFAGLPTDFDGDTQPMPSQIYRDAQSMYKPLESPPNIRPQYTVSQAVDNEQKTLVEGDTGYIDLLGSSDAVTPGRQDQEREVGVADANDESQGTTAWLLSSLNRVSHPKTPAIAGQKRDRQGLTTSPTKPSRSPASGYSAFWSSDKAPPVMTNTQMFNMTQAVSSPLPNVLRSDPIDSRPSPELAREMTASPTLESPTSPLSPADRTGYRALTEPRDMYTSMKDSQRRRLGRQDGLRGGTVIDDDMQDSLEEEDSVAERYRRKMHRQRLENQARVHWDAVAAPSASGARKQRVQTTMEDTKLHSSPMQSSKERQGGAIELSSDEDSEEEGSIDVYDELGQQVISSQRVMTDDNDDVAEEANEDEDLEDDAVPSSPVPEAKASSPVQETYHAETDGTGLDMPSMLDFVVPQSSNVMTAIADSQPARLSLPRLTPQADPSSTSSYVPGSQYNISSSQFEAVNTGTGPSGVVINEDGPPQASGLSSGKLHGNEGIHAPDLKPATADAEVSVHSGGMSHTDDVATEGQRVETSAESSHEEISRRETETDMATMYHTAKSHVSGAHSQQQQPSLSSLYESPRKVAGVARLTEIAINPTPPEDDINIESQMDILQSDDEAFIKATRTPQKKVRHKKVYGRKGKVDTIAETASAQSTAISSTVDPATAAGEDCSYEASPEQPARKRQRRDKPADATMGTHSSTIISDAALAPPSSVQRNDANSIAPALSPSKVGLNPTAPLDTSSRSHATPVPEDAPEATPPSVRKREQAGMHAAENARKVLLANVGAGRNRSRRSSKATPVRKTNAPKATSKRKVRDGEDGPPAETLSKTSPTAQRETIASILNATISGLPTDQAVIETPHGDGETIDVNQSTNGAMVPPSEHTTHLPGDTAPKTPPFPYRVLALFRGNPANYYPATCIGTRAENGSEKPIVRFDDNTESTVETHQICSFELRVNDQIKVDLPKMRKDVYVVTGFTDRVTTESLKPDAYFGDVHGHQTVILMAKQRESLGPMPIHKAIKPVNAPFGSIYLTTTMWQKYADRLYVPANRAAAPTTRTSTPSTDDLAPYTPRSRKGRQSSLLNISIVPKVDFLRADSGTGIFQKMAFALTYDHKDRSKHEMNSLIRQNGGIVLDQGFQELFRQIRAEESSAPASPSKPSDDVQNASDDSTLTLADWAKDLGFVALITNSHSRREKFVQALALSVPCLSSRWIIYSIAAARPLPWSRYLLPAGVSTYLDDAVRSRILAPSDPATSRLQASLESRERLIDGGGVVLVAGSKTWDTRKKYAFLSLAIGADRVRRVDTLEEAVSLVKEDRGRWSWVHCDGKAWDRVKKGGTLSVTSSKSAGQAGTRTPMAVQRGQGKYSVSVDECRIVEDEFVVQSLILGALVE